MAADRNRGNHYLVVGIILVIDNGGLNQDGGSGSCETWSDSEHIPEGEPVRFANGQDCSARVRKEYSSHSPDMRESRRGTGDGKISGP